MYTNPSSSISTRSRAPEMDSATLREAALSSLRMGAALPMYRSASRSRLLAVETLLSTKSPTCPVRVWALSWALSA